MANFVGTEGRGMLDHLADGAGKKSGSGWDGDQYM